MTAAPAFVPALPETAPFSPDQRAWLNGYFAGLYSRAPVESAAAPSGANPSAPGSPLRPLSILFGSQTGTSEALAKQAAKQAGQRGFAATIFDLGTFTPAQLAQQQNILVITSTYGEGEPPDNARAFHTALCAPDNALTLPAGLRYSVCGLGDTNYTLFCQCAKDFDAALAKHGAIRVAPRADCDLDYEAPFAAWLDTALAALSRQPAPAPSGDAISAPQTPSSLDIPNGHSRSSPFLAPVLTVRPLNATGSAKEVNHVEFSLEGSGLAYEAGDALGVVPQNPPELVARILAALGLDGEEAVPASVGELPLRAALTRHFDLGKPPAALLTLCGVEPPPPAHLHVIDVLLAAARRPAAAEFAGVLRKLTPRLYSISSSPRAHPGRVHLTVGTVRYEAGGLPRQGVCSTFLAERALDHGTVGVFVHANKAFRLPASPNTPVIMVGPGTGIAPFRAFLHERAATGARGRNWLFFGDQRAATDFLYRDELDALQTSGVLTRLDLAFSRDQPEKIYVQHRMTAAARELYAWLEDGAHFYVCGDAARMAKDVDAALHQIIRLAGKKSDDEATLYIQALKTARRYQRDVY